MSEKTEYLIQIIEKVKPAKIIDIIYSQPKKIKEKKPTSKLGITFLLCAIGFPLYSFYLLISNPYGKPNLIEIIMVAFGAFTIAIEMVILLINIFMFVIKTYKYKGGVFSRMKKSLYYIKYEWGIGQRDIENHNICHDFYKEISRHFEEDEMLKIVEMKLKNKDFAIDSIYDGKNEKEKAEQKNISIKNIEKLLNNLNEEKILLEKTKEDDLKQKESQKMLVNEFTRSFYK